MAIGTQFQLSNSICHQRIPAIIQRMVKNAHQYEFFQALRLLEDNGFGKSLLTQEATQLQLILRAAKEMEFPASDLRRGAIDNRGNITLEINALGLYGVDSPLPLYFQALMQKDNQHGRGSLQDFLDLISAPIYKIIYLAWEKYHPYHDTNYSYYLNALSGQLLNQDEQAYAGILGGHMRNAHLLSCLLSDFLGVKRVSIQQFQHRWLTTEIDAKLTNQKKQAYQLGFNTILGSCLLDANTWITIKIDLETEQRALDFMKDNNQKTRLLNLINKFLPIHINFDLIFCTRSSTKMTILGDRAIFLGQNICLYRAPLKHDYCYVIPGKKIDASVL